ncbi:hypothetical protein RHSIM_Rhsim08G0012700 [Rhododendron simsii]|uniref:Transmembrane protein n=1 Tax=Rhododendron simsii TaxID=118357 RepID=A0A834LDC1_RHOSS|nr:hypothetical protein RHSIM_Rhsim08G0012700 [Rhododendron simsii]
MSRLYSHFISLKSPNYPVSLPPKHFSNPLHFCALKPKSPNPRNSLSWSNTSNTLHWPVRAFQSDITVQKSDGADNVINLDSFLSIVEILCLASSAVISVGYVVVSSSKKLVFEWLGNRVFVWQFVLLAGAVAIGASIRRRQWRRVCAGVAKAEGSSGVDFVGRIEKLEEDLRSSATIIRVLSRQLEKLGIRFRVTRRALKDPIAEAAALAQKNSEATRALAVQEDILEKELSEIQTVLLAMQEQQQKQLDLILAIAKSGNLFDKEQVPVQKKDAVETRHSAEKVVKQTGTPQIQALASQKEINKEAA